MMMLACFFLFNLKQQGEIFHFDVQVSTSSAHNDEHSEMKARETWELMAFPLRHAVCSAAKVV